MDEFQTISSRWSIELLKLSISIFSKIFLQTYPILVQRIQKFSYFAEIGKKKKKRIKAPEFFQGSTGRINSATFSQTETFNMVARQVRFRFREFSVGRFLGRFYSPSATKRLLSRQQPATTSRCTPHPSSRMKPPRRSLTV